MFPRNGSQGGRNEETKNQRDKGSTGIYDFKKKTKANRWLHLTPRVAALGMDVRTRYTNDRKNPRVNHEVIKPGGEQRGEVNQNREEHESIDA